MTFLATINAKEYVLIAADRMEVANIGSISICVSKDVTKIVYTGIGLMTGTGYVKLLDKVKTEASKTDITHTDQILTIMKDNCSMIRKDPFLPLINREEFIKNTGWLFTYFTAEDEKPTIRVAMYSQNIDAEHFGLVEEYKCYAFFPSDSTPDIRESIMATLRGEMVSPDDSNTVEATLSINSRLILKLMKEMSSISSLVTDSCDIGLVFLDGRMMLAKNVSIQTPKVSFVSVTS